MESEIVRLTTGLFEQIREFDSENWVFDCYIPRTRRKAHLIDINPFAPRTDPGLYEWGEILGIAGGDEGEIGLRLVTEERGIAGVEFSAQRVPRDVVDASQGRSVVEFVVEWEKMLRDGIQDEIESDIE